MKKASGALSPVIAVDRNASMPMYRQIYDGYREAIIKGNLLSGQQIPSTRALATELGISRIPVLHAYAQLLAEGYFESRAGAGTFVSGSLPDRRTVTKQVGAGTSTDRPKNRLASRRSTVVPRLENEPGGYNKRSFSVGQLAFDHFPFKIWARLLTRHCRKVHAGSLTYGDPMGSTDLRETIAVYLRTTRAVRCEARQIMVVSGSQQALDLCARVLLDPGSPVWIEDPGYSLLRSALMLAGCDLIPVPVDGEGLDVAAGIRQCRTARAAFVTPSHQYPLGVIMSAPRRFQLLSWAQTAGAWIVEDDYDSEYRYESLPIASLQGLDRNSRVIYVGTFSKTLFPSLRIGYLVIPHDLVGRFAEVRRVIDVCPPRLYQAALADFMREGYYARHIRKMRQLYSERRSALMEALRTEFGSLLQVVGGEAGMHLVVILPKGLRDQQIAKRAADQNLRLLPLSHAYLGKNSRQGLVLGFASTTVSEMPSAVRRLRSLLTPSRCQLEPLPVG
jgi:GntR family transcriptional regulator/MocR family aminotransferase